MIDQSSFAQVLQALISGKTPNVVEKMVQGRLRKYFEQTVLLDQKFVINDSMNVRVSSNVLIFFVVGFFAEHALISML